MATEYQWSTLLLLFILAGVGTYLLRVSVIVLIGYGSGVPDYVSSTLAFVPPAVLAALAIAGLVRFSPASAPVFEFDPVELFAGVVAAVVAWRTRNVLFTIAIGMIVLWTTQLVVS